MDQHQQNRELRDRLREANEALCLCEGEQAARLRTAIEAVQNELILANIPLVKAIAGRFVWQGPYPVPSFDELFSYGLEALWRASLRVHTIKHDNVGRYLARWIRRMMMRRAIQQHSMHKLHRKRKGQEKHYLEQYRPEEGPTPDDRDAADRWDSILAACEDDLDRGIVELRRQHETYESIMETLKVRSKSTISNRLKKIAKRMDEANDAHEKRHSLCVEKIKAKPGDSPHEHRSVRRKRDRAGTGRSNAAVETPQAV
jgi:RNA polymerase sigma factor (sigma-70 family)